MIPTSIEQAPVSSPIEQKIENRSAAPFENSQTLKETIKKAAQSDDFLFSLFFLDSYPPFLAEKKEEESKQAEEASSPIVTIQPYLLPNLEFDPGSFAEQKIAPPVAPVIASIDKVITLVETDQRLYHLKTVTYLSEHSVFNGLEIDLLFFDTDPTTINIDFKGSPSQMKVLSTHFDGLKENLKTLFPTIRFEQMTLSLSPLIPTTPTKQKSFDLPSQKKKTEGKVIFKPVQSIS